MTSKPYKRYTKAFKLEALRLAEQSEKPVTTIAREQELRVNQDLQVEAAAGKQWFRGFSRSRLAGGT